MTANVMHGDDIGMAERRGRAGLLEEACPVAAFGAGPGQDLDGYGAAEPGIDGSIHLSHPAQTDGGINLIRAELSAGGEKHPVDSDTSRRWSEG